MTRMIGHYEDANYMCGEVCDSQAVDQDDYDADLCETHLIEAHAQDYADNAVKARKEDTFVA